MNRATSILHVLVDSAVADETATLRSVQAYYLVSPRMYGHHREVRRPLSN